MAVTQSLVAEDILSRPERAVLRGIYRASLLADALEKLGKIELTLKVKPMISGSSSSTYGISDAVSFNELRSYLQHAIQRALISTKVPALPVSEDNSSPTGA